MVRYDVESTNTGKVVIYVRNDIRYEIVLTRKLESNCWCAAKEKMYKGVMMVIYHSPSISDRDFVRFLEDIVLVKELIIK